VAGGYSGGRAAHLLPRGSSVARAMDAAVLSPADRLATALGQIGLTACAGTVQRAASFLFEDGQANFIVQPMGADPNRAPTVITIESSHANLGRTRLTTLTVSPGVGCPGFYEQTISWPTPCAELQRTVFAEFKQIRPLMRHVTVSELNAGLQLYLLPSPSGQGCTSVKREMFR
jgi:hypothetical protein